MIDRAAAANTTRYLENWQDEIESAFLYRSLAQAEPQPALAEVYRRHRRDARSVLGRQAETDRLSATAPSNWLAYAHIGMAGAAIWFAVCLADGQRDGAGR